MKYVEDMCVYIDNLSNFRTEGGVQKADHTYFDIRKYVIQYRFQGGPEQPIRYLEMKVDKNSIDADAEASGVNLMDSIVEGQTRLVIDAVDKGTFIISKIWLNDNIYEMTASGIEITLNSATMSQDDVNAINALQSRTPENVARVIFERWRSTLCLWNASDGQPFTDSFEFYSSMEVPHTSGEISFRIDMPTLVAINMCAVMDGAFVFFGTREDNGTRVNTLYYVDYKNTAPLAYNEFCPELNGVLNTYPQMNLPNTNYSEFDLMMFQRLTGTSSKRSEGQETIVNNQVVSFDGGQAFVSDQSSINLYGDCQGQEVSSDKIVTNDADAQRIASNIVRRYKDPTRSISFALSETETSDTGTGWTEIIPVFSYANKIVDNVNGITLTNEHYCDGSVDNFVLRLSTYIRYYPEMSSEYTFGVAKETTMSQELANKLSTMNLTLKGGIYLRNVTYDGSYSSTKPTGYQYAYYIEINEIDTGSLVQVFYSMAQHNSNIWYGYGIAGSKRLYIFANRNDQTSVEFGYVVYS